MLGNNRVRDLAPLTGLTQLESLYLSDNLIGDISPLAGLSLLRELELQNNEIKVSAISLQSGFSSPQRFNVAFRKQMGMTPMEYRKKYL